ncbi:unnamed protein product [Acanthosepion pharaonis]|uniref:Uncharacterized protein n=1 Tax=Acanthosepion pharaonis TaxID=158019 RepID=A0A812E6G8_ACAPH|nr:unnamed protein product [Sepia pharaonis]
MQDQYFPPTSFYTILVNQFFKTYSLFTIYISPIHILSLSLSLSLSHSLSDSSKFQCFPFTLCLLAYFLSYFIPHRSNSVRLAMCLFAMFKFSPIRPHSDNHFYPTLLYSYFTLQFPRQTQPSSSSSSSFQHSIPPTTSPHHFLSSYHFQRWPLD